MLGLIAGRLREVCRAGPSPSAGRPVFLKLAGGVIAALLSTATPSAAAPTAPHGDTIVTTQHSMMLDGRKLNYTARAGLLPLYVNDTGERMGSIFFIAYSVDPPAGSSPRPITFLWNGGPGSNSAQVHVVGFGPKRMTTPDTYPQWPPNTEGPLIDNPQTWLAASDLVFVDPPGTGFSRATNNTYRDVLYSNRGDAEAVAEMIRIYLNRFEGWNRPLFLAGESYGVTRAQLVADALEKRRTHLAGLVLISGGIEIKHSASEALQRALALPHLTATAWYHKRLPPDLQALSQEAAAKQAEAWARSVYAPALEAPKNLTPEGRAGILAGLSRFTGADPKVVAAKTLRIPTEQFADSLLADKGLELGRYDLRMTTRARGKGEPWLTWGDPSLTPMMDLMEGSSKVFNAYVRKDLGFESDLLYSGPFGRAFHPESLKFDAKSEGYADWMGAMWSQAPATMPDKPAALANAMTLNPALRVVTMSGMYDGGGCDEVAERTATADPALRDRIENRCYVGGHMWYSDLEARQRARKDFEDFVSKSLP